MASSADTVKLWAVQAQVVVDTIERDGVYRVKNAYVDQKYGDVAWVFKEAYAFFAHHAQEMVPKPEGAESGVWLYRDPQWANVSAQAYDIELEVPRSEVVLFDMRVWNRILNLQYVPLDEEDEKRFEEKLSAAGLESTYPVFSSAFYPMQKQEIKKSWQRLFVSAQGCPDTYLQGATWEIRREWITNITCYNRKSL